MEQIMGQLSAQDWDEQFKEGRWDYLKSIQQAPHYGVIASYVIEGMGSSVLDIGCGIGLLSEYLFNTEYHGIDLSKEAIKTAGAGTVYGIFEVADADTYTPGREYDYIVFNESLYYMPDPIKTLARYKPRKGFIISMFGPSDMTTLLAIKIAVRYDCTAGCTVKDNWSPRTWTINRLTLKEEFVDRSYPPPDGSCHVTGALPGSSIV